MINGGDSAFPVVVNLAMDPRVEQGGLTKRELFAAMAMQGLRAGAARYTPEGKAFTDWRPSQALARVAVADADALLAELAKERAE